MDIENTDPDLALPQQPITTPTTSMTMPPLDTHAKRCPHYPVSVATTWT